MPQPGDYPDLFNWLRCVRTADGSTGAKPKTYTANGQLWGQITTESANEELDLGAVRAVVIGTVRLRQWPDVSATDRLYLVQWNETYAIEGIRRDVRRNELVCDVRLIVDGVTSVAGMGGARLGGTVGL